MSDEAEITFVGAQSSDETSTVNPYEDNIQVALDVYKYHDSSLLSSTDTTIAVELDPYVNTWRDHYASDNGFIDDHYIDSDGSTTLKYADENGVETSTHLTAGFGHSSDDATVEHGIEIDILELVLDGRIENGEEIEVSTLGYSDDVFLADPSGETELTVEWDTDATIVDVDCPDSVSPGEDFDVTVTIKEENERIVEDAELELIYNTQSSSRDQFSLEEGSDGYEMEATFKAPDTPQSTDLTIGTFGFTDGAYQAESIEVVSDLEIEDAYLDTPVQAEDDTTAHIELSHNISNDVDWTVTLYPDSGSSVSDSNTVYVSSSGTTSDSTSITVPDFDDEVDAVFTAGYPDGDLPPVTHDVTYSGGDTIESAEITINEVDVLSQPVDSSGPVEVSTLFSYEGLVDTERFDVEIDIDGVELYEDDPWIRGSWQDPSGAFEEETFEVGSDSNISLDPGSTVSGTITLEAQEEDASASASFSFDVDSSFGVEIGEFDGSYGYGDAAYDGNNQIWLERDGGSGKLVINHENGGPAETEFLTNLDDSSTTVIGDDAFIVNTKTSPEGYTYYEFTTGGTATSGIEEGDELDCDGSAYDLTTGSTVNLEQTIGTDVGGESVAYEPVTFTHPQADSEITVEVTVGEGETVIDIGEDTIEFAGIHDDKTVPVEGQQDGWFPDGSGGGTSFTPEEEHISIEYNPNNVDASYSNGELAVTPQDQFDEAEGDIDIYYRGEHEAKVEYSIPDIIYNVSGVSVTDVGIDDPLTVEYWLENVGGSSGQNTISISNNEESITQTHSVNPGETESFEVELSTPSSGGNDVVSVETDHDSEYVSVSYEEPTFEVINVSTVESSVLYGEEFTVKFEIEETNGVGGENGINIVNENDYESKTVALDQNGSGTFDVTLSAPSSGSGGTDTITVNTGDDTGSTDIEYLVESQYDVAQMSVENVDVNSPITVEYALQNNGDTSDPVTVWISNVEGHVKQDRSVSPGDIEIFEAELSTPSEEQSDVVAVETESDTETVNVTYESAEFSIANVSVSPSETGYGDEFTVGYEIEEVNGIGGETEVIVSTNIGADGTSESIELGQNESKEFEITLDAPSSGSEEQQDTIIVETDDDVGHGDITYLPADFSVKQMSVSPSEVVYGGEFVVEYEIEETNGVQGETEVTVSTSNGVDEASRSIELSQNESKTYEETFNAPSDGTGETDVVTMYIDGENVDDEVIEYINAVTIDNLDAPSDVAYGKEIPVEVEVKSRTDNTVEREIKAELIPERSEESIDTQTVNLDPYESREISFRFTAPNYQTSNDMVVSPNDDSGTILAEIKDNEEDAKSHDITFTDSDISVNNIIDITYENFTPGQGPIYAEKTLNITVEIDGDLNNPIAMFLEFTLDRPWPHSDVKELIAEDEVEPDAEYSIELEIGGLIMDTTLNEALYIDNDVDADSHDIQTYSGIDVSLDGNDPKPIRGLEADDKEAEHTHGSEYPSIEIETD